MTPVLSSRPFGGTISSPDCPELPSISEVDSGRVILSPEQIADLQGIIDKHDADPEVITRIGSHRYAVNYLMRLVDFAA